MSAADTSPAPSETPARAGRLVAALFGLLALTALELGVVGLPIDRVVRITALVGLAMTKVLVIMTAFMRVGRESRVLRFALLAPFVLGPGFAVALMLDAVFRVTQR